VDASTDSFVVGRVQGDEDMLAKLLTMTEAPVSEESQPKLDWKLPVFLVTMNLIAIAVQWGSNNARMDELFRSRDAQERHLEFIDNELAKYAEKNGENTAFREALLQRLQQIDQKLANLENRPH
jgi:hypothetical protein